MADHTEAIRTMEGRLELISEQIRSPCQGEDHKQLVKELLKECQDQRNQMESIALEVIDKEGGDISFNRITTQLEQLDELHKGYEMWANSSGPPADTPMSQSAVSHGGGFGSADGPSAYDFPSASPGASYLASTSEGGMDDRPHRQASDVTSDTGRRRQKKKDRHRKSDAEDFGFPPQADSFGGGVGESGGGGGGGAGFGAWPGSGDAEANTGWGSETGTGAGMGASGGWGSGAASGGGFEAGGWGATGSLAHETSAPSFSHGGGFPDVASGGGATSGSAFGDSGGAWGTSPSTMPGSSMPGAFGGTFEDSGAGSTPFGTTKPQGGGWGGLDAPSSQGGLSGMESQMAQMHIKQNFAEIAADIEGFKMHFIHSISKATGVAPHRIKVTDVRPH